MYNENNLPATYEEYGKLNDWGEEELNLQYKNNTPFKVQILRRTK